ncbi:tripartite motif-containing protein 2-like [Pecten maximus]|uniref:tripartite motif-containing protein 2-like n=1 Tax=Pecten maximus TaxID=6579 RepID=UPI001458457C|nr:tripartite motif-containing protein 2-like [Pecten maximus]
MLIGTAADNIIEMSQHSATLECSICMSDFNEPRFLSCFHSFCTPCLEPILRKWSRKGSFPCPMCRAEIVIPPEGVNGFQKNFYVAQPKPKAKTTVYKTPETDFPCEIHSTHTVYIYCIPCKQKLCVRCKEEQHVDHDVEYISVASERERLKMAEVTKNAQEFLGSVEETLANAHTEYSRMTKEITSLKLSARDHAEKMKNAIDKDLLALGKHLDSERRARKKKLQQFALEMDDKRKSVASVIQKSSATVMNESEIDILDNSRSIMNRFLSLVRERIEYPREEYSFQPREIPNLGSRAIGDVLNQSMSAISVSIPKRVLYVPMFEVKAISSFKTLSGENKVTSIAPISSTLAWICYNNGKTIYLCNKDGVERKRIALPGKVADISVSREGNLTITSHNGNFIWQVDKTYTGIVREDTFPHKPRDICSSTNGLYATFIVSANLLNFDMKAKLVKFDGDMSSEKEIPITEKDDNILKSPRGISEHANGDLLIANYCGNNYYEIVVFSPSLQILGKFKCETSETTDVLKPAAICCDVFGNTFVSDSDKGRIFLMDKQRDRFRPFLGPEHGITCPGAIAVDGTDHLWASNSDTGTVTVFRYMK